MWAVLSARAQADGTRRELLPLVVTALDTCKAPFDRVWLGALATEISLRDAGHAIVAGGYAEIVAEHAPDHPVLKQLVGAVAGGGGAVPADAVRAAERVTQDEGFELDIDLDGVYAEAAEAATLGVDDLEEVEEPVAPAKVAKPKALARIVPVAKPASQAKRGKPGKPGLAPTVLAALRIPDRPAVPPRPSVPPGVKERPHRIPIAIDVRLHPEGGARIDAHSRDISTTGLFVLTQASLAIGETVGIVLLLPGKEAFAETEYRGRARVARQGEGGYGIELVDPTPELLAALAGL
jgi:hypothetical protein